LPLILLVFKYDQDLLSLTKKVTEPVKLEINLNILSKIKNGFNIRKDKKETILDND
jgi:hypothetical protein